MQIFKNSSFGEVRVARTSENPMFCLVDVCKALDIKNPSDCKSRLKQDGVGTAEVIDSMGRTQQVTFINESNLYKCIFQSRRPDAEKFQDWVCEEVLPSIRKHGAYATEVTIDNIISNPDFGIKLLTNLKEEHKKRIEAENYSRALELQTEEQRKQLELSAPKVKYCEDVLSSTGLLTTNMIAQSLGISAVKLNKLLSSWNVQYRQSDCYFLQSNLRDKGYATHKPYPYTASDGTIKTRQHLYWTEKGKEFIISKFNSNTSTAVGK